MLALGRQVSGGTSAGIGGFQGGTVYDVQMIDDSLSCYLDCVGQLRSGQLLLLSNANACPIVSPFFGELHRHLGPQLLSCSDHW